MLKQHLAVAIAWLLFCGFALSMEAVSSAVQGAGNPYIIDVWNTEDDLLPQNTVTSIIQTRDGYLWFGTLNGLVRFDGIRSTVFDEHNTPGLNNSWIVRLFEDRQGNLWIGTESAGVALIKDGQLTSLGIGQGTSERRLAAACEDPSGAIWLYTADGQLWRYWNGRSNPFLVSLGRPSTSRTLIAEPGGPVWVGTDWGQSAISSSPTQESLELPVEQSLAVGKLDVLLASHQDGYWRLADGRVQKCRTNRVERDLGPYRWGRAPLTAACEDRQGNLVVGTLGVGVYWFGSDGKVSWLTTNQGLSSDVVLSLCVDREGSLWVGTDGGGLNRVKRQVFDVLDASRGLGVNAVQSVCEDHESGLWIGSNGGGVACWKGGVLQRFGPSQGLTNPHIWAVCVDRDQRVWAAAWGSGLFQLQNGQFQRAAGSEALNPKIHAIYQEHNGPLWVGTQGGLGRWDGREWKVFTTGDGLSADEVQAIAEDREGGLWIGTVGGGLNHRRNGSFTSYHKQEHEGLPSEDIRSLYVDAEGVLWIGTGNGLGRFHRGKWTRYTTREGLFKNSINYLLEDSHGTLWIGSNAGIMRVHKQQLNDFARGLTSFIACRAYDKSDGLPTRECTLGSQPAACRSREGRLWFPTVKGLVSVDPVQLKSNPYPPPVKIESVLSNGQLLNTNALQTGLAQPVIVPAGKERLEIHYTSLNLAAPDRARFKYRLEGHETEWTEAGNSRIARYSKLPPGRYRFQVKACNEDEVWNEAGAVLEFLIQPPLWRTWWFLGATAAGLLGMIIAVVHYLSTQKLQRQLAQLEHQEALEKERSRIAQDLHDQLGASLTQVALLSDLVESDKDQPNEVEAHARQISQAARETTRVLDEIVWAINPSNDSLDGLMTYLCKYAQEYLAVAGLRYRLDMPAQLPGFIIPPEFRHHVFLTLKEALTNVVRHAAASAVWVRLRLEPATFVLEIEDNGRGVAGLDEKAAQTRNGLRNMRQRMEGLRGSFSLGPAPEGGTLVRLSVPLGRRIEEGVHP